MNRALLGVTALNLTLGALVLVLLEARERARLSDEIAYQAHRDEQFQLQCKLDVLELRARLMPRQAGAAIDGSRLGDFPPRRWPTTAPESELASPPRAACQGRCDDEPLDRRRRRGY